ncbi:chorismate mutase [Tricharina praecox]|uniref:chorismate mutase n=1 Tax=Tricharina praecox TaxID=43433 RepID=UPI0022209FAB|nr:chorismate mutase [Tricharina praecox]KAI5858031.1 chorismate mutase [Tricharina praecox]
MDSAIDLTDASSALDLSNIRYQLIRLEDTIIFHLIERVQFAYSPSIYTPHGVTIPDFTGSFLDWMLLQQERVHAQVRRYEAPDEYPFFPGQLPRPFLAPLSYPRLLHPNTVNINEKIKAAYIAHILPATCRPHTDRGVGNENYGSAAVMDVACLQALSRRIHFGKFVAEAKFRERPEEFTRWIREGNVKALEDAITKPAVELQVLKRLELKARTYGTDPSAPPCEEGKTAVKINVDAVVAMYRDWVIPMTKEVEIDYLMQRLDPVEENGVEA